MRPRTYLISGTDKLKQNWDMMIIACVVFNSFTIPLDLSFQPQSMRSQAFLLFNLVIDIAFMVDIVVCFRTTY